MVIACIILEVLGGILPIGSAVVAYRRFHKGPKTLSQGSDLTYGDSKILLQSQKADALKGPAIVAGIGILSSTLAGVLSLIFLTN